MPSIHILLPPLFPLLFTTCRAPSSTTTKTRFKSPFAVQQVGLQLLAELQVLIHTSLSFHRQYSQVPESQPSESEDILEEDDMNKFAVRSDVENFINNAQYSLQNKTLMDIFDRVNEVWPVPKVPIPEGWSAVWEEWPDMLSVYWTSPNYLMLPQIEMVVNIYYGVPGETRPIIYSNGAFVFAIVERPSEFYILNYHDGPRIARLSLSEEPLTESTLVGLVATPEKMVVEELEPSEEGSSALERIMARDRSVIPELEKFLGYVPEHTELWEEHPSLEKEKLEKMTEDEQLAELQSLLQEVEARSPEFKEASEAWDLGMRRTNIADDEVDPESVERDINAFGLKEEMREFESMIDSAEGELSKLNLETKPEQPLENTAPDESQSSLRVQVDNDAEDRVRLSVPFQEEKADKQGENK